MTLFPKKTLQELEKREGEMPKKAIKVGNMQEVRRRINKAAVLKEKPKGKIAAPEKAAAAAIPSFSDY
jgi:hypothetical protein